MNVADFPVVSDDVIITDVYALCRKHQWSDALARYDRDKDRCNDRETLEFIRAMALKSTSRQREAIEVLTALVSRSSARADILTLIGMCHRDLAERERALSYLRQAIALPETFIKAHYQLGVVLQEIERHGEAAEAFAKYLAFDDAKSHALAWSLFGVSLRKLERFDASVSAIEHAIDIDPVDIPTRNALVITHYLAGNERAAVAAGRSALELKDKTASRAFSNIDEKPAIKQRVVPFDSSNKSKNIISFSLWGDDPVYTHGAIVNAQLAPHVYPGWRPRFYVDETVPSSVCRELRRLSAEVQIIDDSDLMRLKPLWRFLASDDPEIDRFICRDADSRLNSHEAVAVDAWVKSGLPFHVMRDHIYHMEVMLAGMWGGISRVLPNVRDLVHFAHGYQANKWNDQEFLRDIVWPMVRNHTLSHDSVYRFRGSRDFPQICTLPGKVHVGGAIKRMPPWPVDDWLDDR